MKKFLTVFLSALLCVQNVYAMPAKEYIVYEDTEEAAQVRMLRRPGRRGPLPKMQAQRSAPRPLY